MIHLLLVVFSLMSSGIWGAQSQELVKAERDKNHKNLLAGLCMLKPHSIVVNEYQTEMMRNYWPRRIMDQMTSDSGYVIGEEKTEKCDLLLVNNEIMYLLHQGELLSYDKELEYNLYSNPISTKKFIIFNIIPCNDQSAAENTIAESCKRIKDLYDHGFGILINTDNRVNVEKVLGSFFDNDSWVKVQNSDAN